MRIAYVTHTDEPLYHVTQQYWIGGILYVHEFIRGRNDRDSGS